MEYINDINLMESVVNIADNTFDTLLLNDFKMELTEDVYKFLYRHIDKCLKDKNLKYARFLSGKNKLRDMINEYIEDSSVDIVDIAKYVATNIFNIMRSDIDIPSAYIFVTYISTDKGPLLGILKLDYIKNYTHIIEGGGKGSTKKRKEDIIIKLLCKDTGLISMNQKVEKAAFIKLYKEDDEFNLMVLDKKKKSSSEEELSQNYWTKNFLDCSIITNDRDNTRSFLIGAETWIRNNYFDNASKAEKIRRAIRTSLKENKEIYIHDVAKDVLNSECEIDNFKMFMSSYCEEKFVKDDIFVENKFKKIKLELEDSTSITINEENYNDSSKFDISENEDGSIDIIIKNVCSYKEKV